MHLIDGKKRQSIPSARAGQHQRRAPRPAMRTARSRGLEQFISETAADELMVASAIFDHQGRLRSYEILRLLRTGESIGQHTRRALSGTNSSMSSFPTLRSIAPSAR